MEKIKIINMSNMGAQARAVEKIEGTDSTVMENDHYKHEREGALCLPPFPPVPLTQLQTPLPNCYYYDYHSHPHRIVVCIVSLPK